MSSEKSYWIQSNVTDSKKIYENALDDYLIIWARNMSVWLLSYSDVLVITEIIVYMDCSWGNIVACSRKKDEFMII
jgi:hypothetical protein